MSCWATVSTATNIKADVDELVEAVTRMGFKVNTKTATAVYFNGLTFVRPTEKDAWTFSGYASNTFDQNRFKMQVQRAKSLTLAKKEGYRIVQDEEQNGKLVLRMKIG